MTHVEMDVERYLLRIGSVAPIDGTLDTLRTLHRRHLLSVPFENLTAHSGGRAQVDLPLVYDKIVNQRRGGFCYENNGLFSWLLSEVGFRVTLLSGQVRSAITRRHGPPFDHMIFAVTLAGQRWLCDVGFGGAGFQSPLSLESAEPQTQGHREYRVREEGGLRFVEWRGEGDEAAREGEWTEIYKFTLEPRRREDFAGMCRYHQSSPSSVFFCKSLCTVLKPGGRLTYIGHRLITTTFPTAGSPLESTTRELGDEEIPAILEKEFGVVLPSPLVPKDEELIPPPVMY